MKGKTNTSEIELRPVSKRGMEKKFIETLNCLKGTIASVNNLFGQLGPDRRKKVENDIESVLYHLNEAANLISFIAAPGSQRKSDRILREAGLEELID